MSNDRGIPPLLRYGIFLVVTVVMWIAFETYREFSVKPSLPVPEEILRPLTASLDSAALDELQRRINLGESEIGDTVILSPRGNVVDFFEEENSSDAIATNEGEINEQ